MRIRLLVPRIRPCWNGNSTCQFYLDWSQKSFLDFSWTFQTPVNPLNVESDFSSEPGLQLILGARIDEGILQCGSNSSSAARSSLSCILSGPRRSGHYDWVRGLLAKRRSMSKLPIDYRWKFCALWTCEELEYKPEYPLAVKMLTHSFPRVEHRQGFWILLGDHLIRRRPT